jgi:hypothetical protein
MSKQLCVPAITRQAKEDLACKKRQCCCARTEAIAGHGDALRWKLTGPRSKPPRSTTFRSRGKGRTRGGREGEREATVGAATEEEQRGSEEATTEHALDSILIAPRSSPFASAVAAPRAAGGGDRDETRRGEAWRRGEPRRENGERAKQRRLGETARASSWKRRERGEVGRLLACEDGAGCCHARAGPTRSV